MSCACIPELRNYPNINEAAWKKAMGTVQKMLGSTGISEKIRAVEAGYKAVDTAKLDSQTCVKDCFNPQQFATAKQNAIGYLDTVIGKITIPLDQLRKQLEKKIPEFKSSKTVPKSTREFAEKMATQAATLKKSLDNAFPELELDFDKVIKQKLNNFTIASQKLVSYNGKWDAAISKMKQDAAAKTDEQTKLTAYNGFRTEYIRGFATALPFFAKDPNLGKHVNNWRTLSQDAAQPTEAVKITPLLALLDKYMVELRKDMKASGII